MNRHARRKLEREFSPSERATWRKNLTTFSEATQGVAAAIVVLPHNQQDVAAAAAVGDPTACTVLAAIDGWFDRAGTMPKPALCLGCDTAFHAGVFPGGFAILMPFADPTCAITTGICTTCALHDDLLETATQQWRKLWPGLYTIEGGRA